MSEIDLLMRALKSYVKVPSMYGYPEHAETTCKHITHILLSIIKPESDFKETEQLWIDAAQMLGFGQKFAFDKFETEEYRQFKWNQQEDEICEQIIKILNTIWNEFKDDNKTLKYTSNWIEYLLTYPLQLGSPANIDNTIVTLMSIATTNSGNRFSHLYEEACVKAVGYSNRGLQDFGAREGWTQEKIKISDIAQSEVRVVKGVNEIILRIEAIRNIIS